MVERAAFVEQGRVGGIEIFWLPLAKDASAKGDDAAARIVDRNHQPAAKPVIAVLIIHLNQQARLDQLVFAKMGQRGFQPSFAVGSKSYFVGFDGLLGQPPLMEIRTCRSTFVTFQLRHIPLRRRRHHIIKRIGPLRLFPLSRVLCRNLQPRCIRQLLHRLHKRQAAMVGHPANGIAMRAAPKAMVKALLVIDVKAGRFLIMEWAAPTIFAPRLGDLHRPRDKRR